MSRISGSSSFPAFGRDQHGLDGIALPYLAIAAPRHTAPIVETIQGSAGWRPARAGGARGVEHGFDVPSTDDIFTWSVTFLDAHVRGDPLARARLTRMANVVDGGDDFVLIRYNVPQAPNFGGLW